MSKNRLEAFSDGVLAIIITIMVLEIKVPHGSEWQDLQTVIPKFMSYILSFLYIGIYWGNHHHLLHTVKKVNSTIMLANLNLLFWLTLVPITT
ncbi:MAG: TMEM175 family protein, partial [Ignavibacteria bacterium]